MSRKRRVFRGFRLHIGLFGRRNVGKSSILNAITRQNVSIVSNWAGTTTDPVEKPMELLPLGPVLFIDTAGIDDVGDLGELRVNKTKRAVERTDLAVIITDDGIWGKFEQQLLSSFEKLGTPVIAVFNKSDETCSIDDGVINALKAKKVKYVKTTATLGNGLSDFRQALVDSAPEDFVNNPAIIGDLLDADEMALLVIPIDKEAPKGRLILPQVQTIRDLLDKDAYCMVVKDSQLPGALSSLKRPPKLVVTDSQAFQKVVDDSPDDVLITSFSILFSRFKGDLMTQVEGTLAIDKLCPGDDVLICEACSHHPIDEDIGRVKIPAWLNKYVGGELNYTTIQGHDFPDDLKKYKLVIHCGACMFNRRAMLSRLLRCKQDDVPITNYGLAIAYSLGIFQRALMPFPDAAKLYQQQTSQALK